MSISFGGAAPVAGGDGDTTVNWSGIAGELSDSDMILLVEAGDVLVDGGDDCHDHASQS